MSNLWKDLAKVKLYYREGTPVATRCPQRLPRSTMVLHALLGPRVRYIAIEMGLETAGGSQRIPVPMVVLSGCSIQSIWYSALNTHPRWLSVFDNGSCHLWSYPDF
jgi:hypothetical protein